jgi:hypothetical protein
VGGTIVVEVIFDASFVYNPGEAAVTDTKKTHFATPEVKELAFV